MMRDAAVLLVACLLVWIARPATVPVSVKCAMPHNLPGLVVPRSPKDT